MFHMLTSCNLGPGRTLQAFEGALAEFTTEMREQGLLTQQGPIGRRCRHPIMDTDSERDHEVYFILSFEDRLQCDRAVEYIQAKGTASNPSHVRAYSMIADPVFVCWEDVSG